MPRKSQQASTIFSRARDQVVTATKKRYGGKSGVSNIVKDINMLKSLLNTENKHIDGISSLTTVSNTTPLVRWIQSPAEGNDNTNRDGRSIKIDRIDAILQFTYGPGSSSAISSSQVFRWFLLRQLNTPSSGGSSTFALADFLNIDSNSQYTPMSLPNSDTSEDFHILDQGLVTLDATISNDYTIRVVNVSVLESFHQTFNGTASTNIAENSLFFVCVASTANGAAGASGVTSSFRIWYIDN